MKIGIYVSLYVVQIGSISFFFSFNKMFSSRISRLCASATNLIFVGKTEENLRNFITAATEASL